MRCEIVREHLHTLSDGERLPGWMDYLRVGSHLLGCAGCRTAWQGLRQLRALSQELPMPSPPPTELRLRVLDALPASLPTVDSGFRYGKGTRTMLLKLAGGVAIAVALLAGLPFLRATATPTGEELYTRLTEQVRQAQAATGTVEVKEGEESRRFTFVLLRSGSYKVESDTMCLYGDGKKHWSYFPRRNEYLTFHYQSSGLTNLAVMGMPFLVGLPGLDMMLKPDMRRPDHFGPVTREVFADRSCLAFSFQMPNDSTTDYRFYVDAKTDLPVGWTRKHGLQTIEGVYRDLHLHPVSPQKQIGWRLPQNAKPYSRVQSGLLPKGARAPSFTLPTVDGQTFSLEATEPRPKVILLFFWSYGYLGLPPEKRDEWQYLIQWYQTGKSHGLHVCAISTSGFLNRSFHKAFVQQLAIPFPMALDTSSFEAAPPTWQRYGVTSLPTVYLLDKENRVLAAYPYFTAKSGIKDVLREQGVLPDTP